jgi:hypothetical protein
MLTNTLAQVPPGPCNKRLWAGIHSGDMDTEATDELYDHLDHRFEIYDSAGSEEAALVIFRELKSFYKPHRDKEGKPTGNHFFDYEVNGKKVCQPIYLASAPVSKATLARMQDAIVQSNNAAETHYGNTISSRLSADKCASPPTHHACHRHGGCRLKRLITLSWILTYAKTVGDYLPDLKTIILPRREKTDLYKEYEEEIKAAGDPKVHPGTFSRYIKSAKELSHILVSRLKGNHERCVFVPCCTHVRCTFATLIWVQVPSMSRLGGKDTSSNQVQGSSWLGGC